MSLTCDIGKSIVERLPQERAEALCQYLNYHCVNAIICRTQDDGICSVAVDEACREKALRLIEDYRLTHDEKARKRPPLITLVNEKISDLNVSGMLFIICGAVVFFISVLRLLRVVRFSTLFISGSDLLGDILMIVELLLGALFLFFGIRLLVKAGRIRSSRSSESSHTLKVITWFLGTYSPEDLDKLCESEESGAAPGDIRRRCIRRCINREFEIDDEEYLSYLTEEIYASLYHTRKFGE